VQVKQHKAVKIAAHNNHLIPTKQDMEEAGMYSRNRARTIHRSRTFQEIIAHYLDDERVVKEHSNLLMANKIESMPFPATVEDQEVQELLEEVGCVMRKVVQVGQTKYVYYWTPDFKARKDALELAYRIKGHLDGSHAGGELNRYRELTDEDLNRRRRELLQQLKKKN
jgi:hypothetical protein